MRFLRSAHFGAATLAFSVLSCSGGNTPAASSPVSDAQESHATTPRKAPDAEPEDADARTTAPRATCDDGSCIPCGPSFCPIGWYCDETSAGTPSCGWLPECAQKAGCACVKKALGCACEEQAGAAHVSCR